MADSPRERITRLLARRISPAGHDVAGRAPVAGSGNTQPGDRRSEGVSGGGAEARPSAASANDRPASERGYAGWGEQLAS